MAGVTNEFAVLALVAVVAFAIGGVLAWLLVWRGARLAGRASRDVEVSQLTGERDSSIEARRRQQSELDATTRALDETRKRIAEISEDRAAMAGRFERLTHVESERDAALKQAHDATEARQRAEQRLTEAATRLQDAQERTTLLERVREEFSDRFKALAGELLEEKSKKFTAQNEANLGTLLSPLRDQLGEFRKRIDEVYDKESRERGLLKVEIDSLKGLNQRISEDAVNLAQALKADSRTRGAWGEMVLERLLEMAGLQSGRHFETQVTYSGEGGRQRPDVVVHLPDEKDIIVDSKVSLVAWERFCSATTDVERAAALRDHLDAIRRNIDDLSSKDYSGIATLRTLDFVLMFVPIEAAFVEAVRVDDKLYGYALAKNVSMVSPSTLLATLRTVSHLWRIERRNVNAMEFARVAAQLHDNFAMLIDGIKEVGVRLDRAKDAHEGLLRRLTEGGRGSVLLQVQRLEELGAETKKKLPRELLERAGANVDETEVAPEPGAAEEAAQLRLGVSRAADEGQA